MGISSDFNSHVYVFEELLFSIGLYEQLLKIMRYLRLSEHTLHSEHSISLALPMFLHLTIVNF